MEEETKPELSDGIRLRKSVKGEYGGDITALKKDEDTTNKK